MNLGPYRVGDAPATPVQVDIITDEDLDAYDSATVTIWDPNLVAVGSITVPLEDDFLEFTLPSTALVHVGIHQVSIVLANEDASSRLTLDSIPMVVEPTTAQWHTISTAKALWPGNTPDDVTLWVLLDVARIQCEAFAPRLGTGVRVPVNYLMGQLMQARNILNGQNASPNGDGSEGAFILSPVPLDWAVKQMLRPRKGVPSVG